MAGGWSLKREYLCDSRNFKGNTFMSVMTNEKYEIPSKIDFICDHRNIKGNTFYVGDHKCSYVDFPLKTNLIFDYKLNHKEFSKK